MTQTYVFGGQPAQPSLVSYSDLALTADTEMQWPWVDQNGSSVVPLYLYVTPTGAYSITMPDATAAPNGQAVIIFNVGPSTITILDNAAGAITTITAGVSKYIILRDNSTAAGTWQSQTFGAGSNAVDAAALAGYGLSALSGATLNSNNPVVSVSGDATATASYRAQIFEVTSATGAGTLSFASVSTLGNGWWMGFSNLGSGAWTLDPDGSETIDGQSTIILNPTENCLIFSSGSALYTIGRGRSVDFVYTALNKDVAGNTDVTLTATEASNLLIKLFGTLTGNINVIVPSVVNEYMINNATTGAFTVTVKTSAGSGVVADQGAQSLLKCDGTDVFNAVTSVAAAGATTMADGSSALPGLAFANEITTGFYRPSAGVLGFAVLANSIFTATATGLDLGSHTVTSLAAATTATGAANLGQVQSGASQFVAAGSVTGTADAIELAPSPAIAAYAAGQEFWFIAEGTNTGAVTIATSGLSARDVQANGAALVAGDIVSGRLVGVKDNGTNYQLLASRAAVDHTADIADLAISTAKLADNSVTFAKMQATTDGTLLGASGGTAIEPISVGSGLTLSANTLSVTASTLAISGYIYGCGIANNALDANNDIDFAAGSVADSTGAAIMTLAGTLVKRLDANWAVGTNQGGLDTGSEASSTWYYCYIIERPDTGVVDALFSASATSPTMPTNYTLKRLIGAFYNNGSSNIVAFKQRGTGSLRAFYFNSPIADIDATNPGTSAVARTLTVPPLRVKALLNAGLFIDTTTPNSLYLSATDQTDLAPQPTTTAALAAPGATISGNTATSWAFGYAEVWADTSSQVRSRCSATSAASRLGLVTLGWEYQF